MADLGALPVSRPQRLRRSFSRLNWPLAVGGLLVSLVLLLAVFGPEWAPRDPLAGSAVLKVGDKFFTAPFAPFAVPGFPLGSDAQGRDVFSQLLWAVRPTLTLVAIVGVVRMLLGMGLGLLAGWTTGRLGRLLNALISGALAAPTFIVALAVVAARGPSLATFIVGLALTGWAETARLVQEQVRGLKGQTYVEAARALGGSDGHLLRRHILPHVLPLAWMLFAFEVSSALLAAAGLGFLGYYTDAQWIMITDTAAQRIAGLPELGLMLSTASTDMLTGPWKMFAAGSLVFFTVLGFNLLGEGARLHFSAQTAAGEPGAWERAGHWVEDHVAAWLATPRGRWALAGGALAVALLAGGLIWWQSTAAAESEVAAPVLAVPGGHLWASTRHDPWGTAWVDGEGPQAPGLRWSFNDPSGLAGGPVVAAAGTVYVAGLSQTLYALDPDSGQPRWTVALPEVPVGAPALGADGTVYVVDVKGGLSAVSAAGELQWHSQPAAQRPGTAGPTVAPSGVIYYPIAGTVRAVDPDGRELWSKSAVTRRVTVPVSIDVTGELVFLQGVSLRAADGTVTKLEGLPPSISEYVVGGDGRQYLRFENLITPWRLSETGVQMGETLAWEWRNYAWGFTLASGVTRSGQMWFSYGSDFEDARFVLVRPDGQVAGFVRYPHRAPIRVIALDAADTAYVCGLHRTAGGAECLGLKPGVEEPVWQVSLPGGGVVNGGALVPGRLYVSLAEGYLHALADGVAAGGIPTPVVAQVSGGAVSPTVTGTFTPLPLVTATLVAVATATVTPALAAACPNPYIVQRGDWLYQIARLCQVDPSALIAANPGLNPSRLMAGQRLTLPSPTSAAPPAAETAAASTANSAACTGTVTVASGDNVFRLATNCGYTILELARANDLQPPYRIFPGQVLRYP